MSVERVVVRYWVRVLIAFDQFVQATFRLGTPGVTISSRAGTASAHGHRWGHCGCWLLNKARVFKEDHCRNAIRHDLDRARAVIAELSDPVVVKWLKGDKKVERSRKKIEPAPTDNRFVAFLKAWPMHIITVLLLLAVAGLAPQQLSVLVFKAFTIFLAGTLAYWMGRANGLTDPWHRIALMCAAMLAIALAA